jgi:hypothetical protein
MKNNMLKKRFIRCQRAFKRFTYSNISYLILEPTISLTNITTQPSANAVTTTGVTSSQDGVIPIASLFSSSDLGQPSATATSIPSPPKKQTSTSGALMRRSPPTDQDRGQTPS